VRSFEPVHLFVEIRFYFKNTYNFNSCGPLYV
jgi:hypothetical protein